MLAAFFSFKPIAQESFESTYIEHTALLLKAKEFELLTLAITLVMPLVLWRRSAIKAIMTKKMPHILASWLG